MTRYRAFLLGGVCLGLLAPQALAQDTAKDTPAWAAEATMNPDYQPATESASPTSEEVAPAQDAVVAAEPEASKDVPAWAAEATMNPDYEPLDEAAPADEAEAPATEQAAPEAAAAVEEELPKGPPGVTEYYGDTQSSKSAPWSAEATMNADYEAAKSDAEDAARKAAADAEAAAKAAAEEAEAAVKKAAADAEAAAKKAAEEAEAAAKKVTEETSRQAAVESCRDALNGAISDGIQFSFNSASINSKSNTLLDKVAEITKDCPANTTIEVGGHTDNTGSAEANQRLSERRAQAVMAYLVKAGVDAAKLKATGYGQDKPVEDNSSSAGRAKNRRIEFLIIMN